MIFSCDTAELKAALATAGRVIPAKSPIAIFTAVKLVTNDTRVTVIGTDGDRTVEIDVAADVQTEGVAVLPFVAFRTFVQSSKAEILKIDAGETDAKVSAGRSRIKLSVWPAMDYPNYRAVEIDPVEVDARTFARAMRFCAAASATDDAKWSMAGVRVQEHDGHVEMWGTDGNAAHHATLPELPGVGGEATIPADAVEAILPIAERAETLHVAVTDRGWQLATKGIRIWGKVIDGGYPDMHRVVNGLVEPREIASADRSDLTAAIGIASCGTETDSGRSRNLILRADKGGPILMRGHKPSGGVVEAGLAEVDVAAANTFAVALSGKYLTGAITGMDEDRLTISAAGLGGDRQAVILAAAQSSATLTMSAVVMVMRVAEEELKIEREAA